MRPLIVASALLISGLGVLGCSSSSDPSSDGTAFSCSLTKLCADLDESTSGTSHDTAALACWLKAMRDRTEGEYFAHINAGYSGANTTYWISPDGRVTERSVTMQDDGKVVEGEPVAFTLKDPSYFDACLSEDPSKQLWCVIQNSDGQPLDPVCPTQ
jgi:hypothetical protein